jgi:hypothetical protein
VELLPDESISDGNSEKMRPIREDFELIRLVRATLGPRATLHDAETLIGFYRYFDFPLSEVQTVFPYPAASVGYAWRVIGGDDTGESGLPVANPNGPHPRVDVLRQAPPSSDAH